MNPNSKKKKVPVPQTRFFSLLKGRLEDALLIYSNMIDEPIEVDPALDSITEPCISFMPFPTQPPYEEGLKEIEYGLLKYAGVVIKRRNGKVYAELKSGPTKAPAGRRPVHKPLHDVVLHVPAEKAQQYASSRWPGEQSRKRLKDGTIELHLSVPNLEPLETWLGGTCFKVIAMAPEELRNMIRETLRKIIENHTRPGEDGFSA